VEGAGKSLTDVRPAVGKPLATMRAALDQVAAQLAEKPAHQVTPSIAVQPL